MIVAAAFAATLGALAQGEAPEAALRGLDKFSGLTQDLTAPVGEDVAWERLIVRVLTCRAQADGDSAAYVEIRDARSPDALAFSGWMIASTPALSALDHPRYDVWLISCSTASGKAS